MAQLYQPTNITPDTRGAFGNGVIINEDRIIDDPGGGVIVLPAELFVSWQVNGNTPMTAYQIDFYNYVDVPVPSSSDNFQLIYSTGKVALNQPFYGYDGNGNIQIFTADVGLLELIEPGDYPSGWLKIRQWWGDGENDYVDQVGFSSYYIRPRLEGSFTHTPYNSKTVTFTGSFTNTGGDGILWHRWVLTDSNHNVMKDTGKIYGNAAPSLAYDGFLPGSYYIQLSGETSVGVTTKNEYYTGFTISYDVTPTGMDVEATKACGGESAVQVRWPLVSHVPLTDSYGFYSAGTDTVGISNGAYLVWEDVNTSPMSLEPDWTVLWRGTLTGRNDSVFSLVLTGLSRLAFSYVPRSGGGSTLSITWTPRNGSPVTVWSAQTSFRGGELFLCLTPDTVYYWFNGGKGFLTPKNELLPAGTLYPSSDELSVMGLKIAPAQDTTYAGLAIRSVRVTGPQTTQYLKILDHGATEREVLENYVEEDGNEFGIGTFFLFSAQGEDFDAGNYYSADLSDLTGVAVYRKSASDVAAEFVANLPISTNGLLDYGAASQQGPYTYYLYMLGTTTVSSTPSLSNEVNPCFWNWSVLSCTQNDDGTYLVEKSYLFGKNLTSGSVSNNNRPGVWNNFSRYPLVQIAPQNYASGTLQSLIGTIDYAGGQNAYSDTVDLKNEIYALSTTTNYLFLKNRKGDIWMIRPSGEITMSTMDETREQAQTVSFPWVEVGDASGASLYQPLSAGTGGA